jgi:hypothetical protein
MMTYARGRNWLPDNKHPQKSELCVIVNIVTHLIVTPTGKLHIKISLFSAVKLRNPSQALALAVPRSHGLFFILVPPMGIADGGVRDVPLLCSVLPPAIAPRYT